MPTKTEGHNRVIQRAAVRRPNFVVRMFDNRVMLETVQRWNEEAAKTARSPLWPLADVEVLDVLQAVHQVQQVVAVLQVRIVQEAASRGGSIIALSISRWRSQLRSSRLAFSCRSHSIRVGCGYQRRLRCRCLRECNGRTTRSTYEPVRIFPCAHASDVRS